MTPEEADKVILTLYAAFPFADNGIGKDQAKARRLLYRNMLMPRVYGTAIAAAQHVIRTSEFFPTVAALEAAYRDQIAPHPERIALPPADGTAASPEEIKAAFDKVREILGR